MHFKLYTSREDIIGVLRGGIWCGPIVCLLFSYYLQSIIYRWGALVLFINMIAYGTLFLVCSITVCFFKFLTFFLFIVFALRTVCLRFDFFFVHCVFRLRYCLHFYLRVCMSERNKWEFVRLVCCFYSVSDSSIHSSKISSYTAFFYERFLFLCGYLIFVLHFQLLRVFVFYLHSTSYNFELCL